MNERYDVYHNPEKFGLRVVAEIEYSDNCYQFDTRVVWEDEIGTRYTARDSGCSCPSPFEDYTSLVDLDYYDFSALLEEVNGEIEAASGEYRSFGNDNIADDGAEFISRLVSRP